MITAVVTSTSFCVHAFDVEKPMMTFQAVEVAAVVAVVVEVETITAQVSEEPQRL